jgi:hypothetical protein
MMHYDAKGVASWLKKLGGFDDVFILPFLRAVVCLKDALKARDYANGGIETDEEHSASSPVTPGATVNLGTMRRRHSVGDAVNLREYQVRDPSTHPPT